MTTSSNRQRRIVIFSRYNLADQYDLAPEYRGMLESLAKRHPVLHLSFKGHKQVPRVPEGVQIIEIEPTFDRSSSRSIARNSLRMYLQLGKAGRVCSDFKPNLIFIPEILPMVGLIIHYICKTRIATAYGDWHVHNMLANRWWSKPVLALAERLDRFEVQRLDGFFCRASTAGERIQRWGRPANCVRVVRDSPDPDAYFPRDAAALRRLCGFAPNDIVFSYHGVMHAGKGLDKLIHWIDEMFLDNPTLGLMLIGSGPEEQHLRRLAAHSRMRCRIYFTGWLKTVRDVGDHINASDIGVAMRTKAEANDRVVPGALLHNMACRKITMAPNLSGCAEIICHGQNGFLFNADDGEDFKEKATDIISNWSLYERVAEQAHQEIVRHYSVAAAAESYAAAIEHFSEGPIPRNE